MRLYKTFLIISLFAYPMIAFGAGETVSTLKSDILNATTLGDAKTKLDTAVEKLATFEDYKDNKVSDETKAEAQKRITSASTEISENAAKGPSDTRSAEDKEKALKDKKDAYEEAKAKEQSTANKTLTALTTAATGIGGMELAQGLSEQKADKEADEQMDAYIASMSCSYASGKRFPAGIEEIELPGGNDPEIMKLRNEYLALAASLKERKEALGMKAGIEAEEILDKSTMGLYDDENVGVTGGNYSSLYRAKMLGSEEDQAKIDEDKKASKNRVIAGGVLAGVGVAGGILGNSLINGKLGEKIKAAKEQKKSKIDTEKTVSVLDKETVVKTLTKDDIIKLAGENGLTINEKELED